MDDIDKEKVSWYNDIEEIVKDHCDNVDDIDFHTLGMQIADLFNYITTE